MKTVNEMSESELRAADVPWPQTAEELSAYIETLVKRQHDYGTCVYAMSMAATAALQYVAHVLGVTGFQASCADMDIIRRTRGYKHGFRLIDFGNLLYPQYCDDDHFPNWQGMLVKYARDLVPAAKDMLKERGEDAHPAVAEHWRMIAALPVKSDG